MEITKHGLSSAYVVHTTAKCTKINNARAKRATLLFFLSMQICDVLVVVA